MSLYEALSQQNHRFIQRAFQQFRQGNKEVFKEIYGYHYGLVFLFVDRLTGNPDEAQDITIEAFAKLWEYREKINDFHSIKSFLYTTAGNKARDYLRRAKMKQFHHAQISKLQDITGTKIQDNLHDEGPLSMIYAEVLEAILEEIERLPPVRKAVFKKIFLEDMSTEEVAQELSISTQTVLNHKSKAVNYLRIWAKSQQNLSVLFLLELFVRHHL